MATEDKVEVENPNSPGKTSRVNKAKYQDMRQASIELAPLSAVDGVLTSRIEARFSIGVVTECALIVCHEGQ